MRGLGIQFGFMRWSEVQVIKEQGARGKGQLWFASVVILTAVILPQLPVGNLQQETAVMLLWLFPAVSWFLILQGSQLERLLTAAGLSMLLNVFATLLLHYLPGPLPQPLLLIMAVLMALLPLILPWFGWARRREKGWVVGAGFRSHRLAPTLGWIGLLLLILLLRLPNFGYKEIQGDEGIILVRAATALLGDDSELFLHQKGPVEILFPMLIWGTTGAINEFWARIPFLWAGILTVLTLTQLSRRWFGEAVGWIAGVLLAINGFAVPFSRIVQYQTFVLLWGLLALLHADRFRKKGRRGDLWLTAVFLAGGLLSHYDAVLFVPAIFWLLLWKINLLREQWRDWLLAGLAGGGMLVAFYLPFMLNPNFGRTSSYLLGARIGQATSGSIFSWSGAEVWQMLTFYNSTYYIVGLILLLLVGIIGLWWQKRERVVTLLFFGIPTLFYTVIVADPRTHVYMIFPGAIVLAAVGMGQLWKRPFLHLFKPILATLFALFVAISAIYVYLFLVDNTPERQRTWAQNRLPFYATTWTEPPQFGLFGFPYQAGWRAVAQLPLALPYASNEEEEITNVYMAQANRTHCANFETFILAKRVQDEVVYDPAWLEGMNLQAEVMVNGRSTLKVYGREEVTAVKQIEASNQQRWLTPHQVAAPTYGGQYPLDITLGDNQLKLLGYDIDTQQAYPGGQIILTLYWQPLLPFSENYQIFTHLYDGEFYGQDDTAPECAMNPTTRWEPGQIIPDPHIISINLDAPTGEIPILVGAYNLISKERLHTPDRSDNAIQLPPVLIHPVGQK